MNIHYYLSLFPIEALIASNLEPVKFGVYMATGSKRGAFEGIMFIEIDGGFGSVFDWDYAMQKCIPHQNGDPKNSLYLSVYRTLENTPLAAMRSLYLTTRDGRTLELRRSSLTETREKQDYWVYQELCPIRPLAVSLLEPERFSGHMTDRKNKTWVPKIVFADLKVQRTPSTPSPVSAVYDRNLEHLKDCIRSITELKSKPNKIVDRSHIDQFSYNLVDKGVFVGDGNSLLVYPMKSIEELRNSHYEWARSAKLF